MLVIIVASCFVMKQDAISVHDYDDTDRYAKMSGQTAIASFLLTNDHLVLSVWGFETPALLLRVNMWAACCVKAEILS